MSSKLSQSIIFWKAKNRDPDSFAKVYDIYVDKIFRFIFFKVSDKDLAQDLTAETFLKTWEYINSGQKKVDNLNALLYRVARNLVIDHYRKKSTHNINVDHLDQVSLDLDLASDQGRKVEEKVDLEVMVTKISELKDEYRDVLILKYIEEFKINEIAKIMDKKPGNVRVTLHRAHKALKSLLEEEK